MTHIRFLRPDGTVTAETDAPAGVRLLEIAQGLGQPLEGTCEGQMACSTCHVILSDADFDRLPPASAHEDDLLDLAPHVTRNSRLACQILIDGSLDTLTVRLPGEARDMQGR